MTIAEKTFTALSIGHEQVVEQHLVAQLVAGQGYVERKPIDYDRTLALDKEILLRFLRESQPQEWARFAKHHAATAENVLFTQLAKKLNRTSKTGGTLETLRGKLDFVEGFHFKLCNFQPSSGANQDLVQGYEANILSAIRQVRYSRKHDNELDVVLFVNGIPVATLELKNTLTGSTVRHAEAQYRTDRAPAGEPLLTFRRGALVHFALDQDHVSMTTRLKNGDTHFLPFNRGRDGGAGNPDVAGEFRIAYLYRDLPNRPAVFGRETWLGIIQNFVHIDTDDTGKESLIFPRFQQLDAVGLLAADAAVHGAGRNYLIQHSAGSGKSNTIAWAADRLNNLHDAHDEPIFNTAIVVSDRIVLDRQLQDTIKKFAQTPGVVQTIDGTSKQLRAAIEAEARIIITTIQKFGTEHLTAITGQSHRSFAVLVDEAHGSQSGKSAQALSDALTRDGIPDETLQTPEAIEDLILAQQAQRGPQPNLSYVGFTATPRHVTLERFGVKDAQGKPHPFHLYSMRQAIEEGFILDVLQHYMTYRAYYELEKSTEGDPSFKTSTGRRQVARFAHLHPTAIGQKVEVIVEHFRRHVLPELGGQAKGMVVTGSREAAVRYFLGLKRYIADQGYTDIRPLVAFSGELTVDGQSWTEAQANDFPESQTRDRFDATEDYRLLVVAEKYQTGYDQPKLCAMYVDRKLAGLQAVQTLSRLNRTMPGKTRTYILDFQNTIEEIQAAFKPYFEAAELEAPTDLNQIYDLRDRLEAFKILYEGEIDRFVLTYFRPTLTTGDRAKLEGIVKEAVARFQTLDEAAQEEFRGVLKSFVRFYAFVAQVVSLQDAELEKLSVYGEWLVRLLPAREIPADVTITDDMLRLHAFKIEQREAGDARLAAGDGTQLAAINEFAAKPYTAEEEEALSEIVKAFNERHGTQFTEEDLRRFDQVNAEIMDTDMIELLRNNPPDVVYTAFRDAFFKGAISLFQRDAEMKSIVLTDAYARDKAIQYFFDRAVRVARLGP